MQDYTSGHRTLIQSVKEGESLGVKNRLKEIRMKEHMMSQKEFAELLNIDYSMYNRIENNMKSVTLETALKISKKLNKTVNEIFELG